MRQRLIDVTSMLLFCLISGLAFGITDNHLEKLKSKFPYGLLGNDHGILTQNDLATNACSVVPRPFNQNSHFYPYEYWQCFEKKTISFDCDSDGVPDEHEGVMGLIVVKASIDGNLHDYIERRLWPIKDCKQFIRDAAALLKGSGYACISGSLIHTEMDHSGHPSTSWIFGRIKTKIGCEGRDCDFKKAFNQKNCPALKSYTKTRR